MDQDSRVMKWTTSKLRFYDILVQVYEKNTSECVKLPHKQFFVKRGVLFVVNSYKSQNLPERRML